MNGTPVQTATLETETKTTKSGYKTTEFWVSVISASAAWVGALTSALPPELAAKVTGAVAFGYGIARGLAKLG